MKTEDLSKIMRNAWTIARNTGKMFSECLRKAWELWRLIGRMHTQAVRFVYLKTDGTIREALGTFKDTEALIKGTGRTDCGHTVKYYDIEAGGFRSFKVENYIRMA